MVDPMVWNRVERDLKFIYLLALFLGEHGFDHVKAMPREKICDAIGRINPIQERFLAKSLSGLHPESDDNRVVFPFLTIRIHRKETEFAIHLDLRGEEQDPASVGTRCQMAFLILVFREFLSGQWGGSAQHVYVFHSL